MRTLTILGVGLIGGSIALAARARGVAQRIIGVGRSSANLEHLRKQGLLDEWHVDLQPAVHDADLAVVCTPVHLVANHVFEISVCARPDTLITDVGSTKAVIVKDLIGQLRQGACFVGSHPLAGSEKSGAQFADARLFENRLVVLTPNSHFDPKAAVRAAEFWQALGARIKVMTPEEHDKALAITSHLPHLVAAALASMLPAELRELTASGFRDTTRVAGGDPALWRAIFGQNQEPLADALAQFQTILASCVTDWGYFSERVGEILIEGKRNRDALGS